jgi:GT2 family glycosyltransferase
VIVETPGPPVEPAIRLSVVIPTYRAPAIAFDGIRALLPIPAWAELLLVDDGSGDETVTRARELFPQIQVVGLDRNRGFGGAVNAGFLQARGAFLATINNDCRASWADVDQLVRVLDGTKRAGAAAPGLRNTDGSIQRVAFSFPRPLPGRLLQRILRPRAPSGNAPFRTDYAKGACVVFRRQALEDVGLFDEQYWMFAEEIDLFRRLANGGWDTWIVPTVQVTHIGGETTRNHPNRDASSRFRVQSYRSMCRYWTKHHGILGRLLLRAEMIGHVGARLLVAVASSLVGRSDPWWIGEHLRCLRTLFRRWPSRPREPALPPRTRT